LGLEIEREKRVSLKANSLSVWQQGKAERNEICNLGRERGCWKGAFE